MLRRKRSWKACELIKIFQRLGKSGGKHFINTHYEYQLFIENNSWILDETENSESGEVKEESES